MLRCSESCTRTSAAVLAIRRDKQSGSAAASVYCYPSKFQRRRMCLTVSLSLTLPGVRALSAQAALTPDMLRLGRWPVLRCWSLHSWLKLRIAGYSCNKRHIVAKPEQQSGLIVGFRRVRLFCAYEQTTHNAKQDFDEYAPDSTNKSCTLPTCSELVTAVVTYTIQSCQSVPTSVTLFLQTLKLLMHVTGVLMGPTIQQQMIAEHVLACLVLNRLAALLSNHGFQHIPEYKLSVYDTVGELTYHVTQLAFTTSRHAVDGTT